MNNYPELQQRQIADAATKAREADTENNGKLNPVESQALALKKKVDEATGVLIGDLTEVKTKAGELQGKIENVSHGNINTNKEKVKGALLKVQSTLSSRAHHQG